MFKTAWHGQAPALQCFGSGQNIVPTIHVKDLAGVLVNICDQKPKVRYMVAVDESKNTLEEIVKVKYRVLFFPKLALCIVVENMTIIFLCLTITFLDTILSSLTINYYN